MKGVDNLKKKLIIITISIFLLILVLFSLYRNRNYNISIQNINIDEFYSSSNEDLKLSSFKPVKNSFHSYTYQTPRGSFDSRLDYLTEEKSQRTLSNGREHFVEILEFNEDSIIRHEINSSSKLGIGFRENLITGTPLKEQFSISNVNTNTILERHTSNISKELFIGEQVKVLPDVFDYNGDRIRADVSISNIGSKMVLGEDRRFIEVNGYIIDEANRDSIGIDLVLVENVGIENLTIRNNGVENTFLNIINSSEVETFELPVVKNGEIVEGEYIKVKMLVNTNFWDLLFSSFSNNRVFGLGTLSCSDFRIVTNEDGMFIGEFLDFSRSLFMRRRLINDFGISLKSSLNDELMLDSHNKITDIVFN